MTVKPESVQYHPSRAINAHSRDVTAAELQIAFMDSIPELSQFFIHQGGEIWLTKGQNLKGFAGNYYSLVACYPGDYNKTIVLKPSHFPNRVLQGVFDGKIKNGDRILVKVIKKDEPNMYEVEMNEFGHIILCDIVPSTLYTSTQLIDYICRYVYERGVELKPPLLEVDVKNWLNKLRS